MGNTIKQEMDMYLKTYEEVQFDPVFKFAYSDQDLRSNIIFISIKPLLTYKSLGPNVLSLLLDIENKGLGMGYGKPHYEKKRSIFSGRRKYKDGAFCSILDWEKAEKYMHVLFMCLITDDLFDELIVLKKKDKEEHQEAIRKKTELLHLQLFQKLSEKPQIPLLIPQIPLKSNPLRGSGIVGRSSLCETPQIPSRSKRSGSA